MVNDCDLLFPELAEDCEPIESEEGNIYCHTGDRGENYFDFLMHELGIKVLQYNDSQPRVDRVVETNHGNFLKLHIKTSQLHKNSTNNYYFNFRIRPSYKTWRQSQGCKLKYAAQANYFVCIGILPGHRLIWWLPFEDFKDKRSTLTLKTTSLPEYRKIPPGLLPGDENG